MKRIGKILGGVLVLAAIPSAGCYGEADVGEKPDVLRFGIIADMIGPNAAVSGPATNAIVDAVQYINDHGGIKGVPVEAVVKDCGGKIDLATSQYTELLSMNPKPVLLFITVDQVAEALHDRIAEDKMVTLAIPSAEAVYPPAYTFGWYPFYSDLFGVFCDWLADTWDKPTPPKLAFVTWDNTYGRAVLSPECYEYAKSKGIDIVATELYSPREVNIVAQLTRVKEKGADWIFTNALATGPVRIIMDLKSMEYSIPIAGSIGLEWASLYALDRETRQTVEGFVTVLPCVSWDETGLRGVKIMKEYFDTSYRQVTRERITLYEMGMAVGLVGREVVTRAIDNVGWTNLSGDVIKGEMLQLRGFSPMGLAYFTFTKDRYVPSRARVYRFTNDGEILPISDWCDVPDLRPAELR